MYIECTKDFTAKDTGTEYAAGNIYDVQDTRAAALIEMSKGAFVKGEAPRVSRGREIVCVACRRAIA